MSYDDHKHYTPKPPKEELAHLFQRKYDYQASLRKAHTKRFFCQAFLLFVIFWVLVAFFMTAFYRSESIPFIIIAVFLTCIYFGLNNCCKEEIARIELLLHHLDIEYMTEFDRIYRNGGNTRPNNSDNYENERNEY